MVTDNWCLFSCSSLGCSYFNNWSVRSIYNSNVLSLCWMYCKCFSRVPFVLQLSHQIVGQADIYICLWLVLSIISLVESDLGVMLRKIFLSQTWLCPYTSPLFFYSKILFHFLLILFFKITWCYKVRFGNTWHSQVLLLYLFICAPCGSSYQFSNLRIVLGLWEKICLPTFHGCGSGCEEGEVGANRWGNFYIYIL